MFAEVAKATLEKTFAAFLIAKTMLARQLGYDSFSSMLAASTVRRCPMDHLVAHRRPLWCVDGMESLSTNFR